MDGKERAMMKRGMDLPTLQHEQPSRAPWVLGALAVAGGYLAYRAMRGGKATQGRSPVASVRHGAGVKATRVVTIAKEQSEVFAFWRDFANLPRFMSHLERVEVLSPQRSRWTTIGPLGKPVTWEAVIHNEVPGELIAWRSIEPADISHAGSVRFSPAPGGRGTEVKITMEYDPPLGSGRGSGTNARRGAGPAGGRQPAPPEEPAGDGIGHADPRNLATGGVIRRRTERVTLLSRPFRKFARPAARRARPQGARRALPRRKALTKIDQLRQNSMM
jgi:uncharacterized membrane protein